jgi:acyl-coenzyme A synthetase/AMP-(fatty) acid ligase
LSPETVIFYVGLVRKGITTIMIPENTSKDQLKKLVESYSPNYIISSLQSDSIDRKFSVLDTYKKFLIYENSLEKSDLSLRKIAICLPTSGSTGSPKFVKLSRTNLESNAKSIISTLKITSDQITITTMPIHYSYGLSVLNTSLEVGAKLVVTSKQVVHKEFWQLVVDHEVNTISGVPFMYEQIMRISVEFLRRTKIKKFTQAGGKLNKLVHEHFIKICADAEISFYIMYGQTEATARISVLPSEEFDKYKDSIGFAIPGGKLTLIDDVGNNIGMPGIIGEICYEGPNVFIGYANNRNQLVASDSYVSKLQTGDIGYFDKEGRFYITGRLKRIAKLLGHRINLVEVEDYLLECGFETVCVEHDAKLNVVYVGDQKLIESRDLLLDHLRINPKLVSFKMVSSIPRLASGKVDYSSVIELLGES